MRNVNVIVNVNSDIDSIEKPDRRIGLSDGEECYVAAWTRTNLHYILEE